jgi:uncharacterized Zn finger protein (UPF0148 family)
MPEDPKATKSPRPKLSEIGRLDSACPYCAEPLARRPERKTICPHCRNAIFVRMRPLDRERVLLTEQQAGKIEAEWTALQIWSKRRG